MGSQEELGFSRLVGDFPDTHQTHPLQPGPRVFRFTVFIYCLHSIVGDAEVFMSDKNSLSEKDDAEVFISEKNIYQPKQKTCTAS